jgi:hypothetical protein
MASPSASWSAHISVFKQNYQLSNAQLTLPLFTLALGAILAMPVIGSLFNRFDSSAIAWKGQICYAVLLVFTVLDRVSDMVDGSHVYLRSLTRHSGCIDKYAGNHYRTCLRVSIRDLILSGRVGALKILHTSFSERHAAPQTSPPWILDRRRSSHGPWASIAFTPRGGWLEKVHRASRLSSGPTTGLSSRGGRGHCFLHVFSQRAGRPGEHLL